jgi:hypothetical protein
LKDPYHECRKRLRHAHLDVLDLWVAPHFDNAHASPIDLLVDPILVTYVPHVDPIVDPDLVAFVHPIVDLDIHVHIGLHDVDASTKGIGLDVLVRDALCTNVDHVVTSIEGIGQIVIVGVDVPSVRPWELSLGTRTSTKV